MLFITMPILFHVERNNLITQCIMVKFSFLLIWCDSDSEWCHYYFASTDAMIQDRVSFFNGLGSLVKVIAFEDKEIPNHQVLEYLGDFYRVDNKVEFVNAPRP